jgi:hypothetical protein
MTTITVTQDGRPATRGVRSGIPLPPSSQGIDSFNPALSTIQPHENLCKIGLNTHAANADLVVGPKDISLHLLD